MSIVRRNSVEVACGGATPMMFAHGDGCDQHMWRLVAPSFENDDKVALYALTGAGGSDLPADHRGKDDDLPGHATDLVEICDGNDLSNAGIVGRSVSAVTARLAANREPERFSSLAMAGPSPCDLHDGNDAGGFEPEAKFLKHSALALQCSDNVIPAVGEWLSRNLARRQLVAMKATGHCPHVSAPAEPIVAMRKFPVTSRNFKDMKS